MHLTDHDLLRSTLPQLTMSTKKYYNEYETQRQYKQANLDRKHGHYQSSNAVSVNARVNLRENLSLLVFT